jgi:hypothetical protein
LQTNKIGRHNSEFRHVAGYDAALEASSGDGVKDGAGVSDAGRYGGCFVGCAILLFLRFSEDATG